jgi:N-acetylneuraminic acid mutarotase
MMALISLSGCHGAGSAGNYKVRWVNETDSKKVLELTLQNPTVMGRLHMTVFGGRVRGTYVFTDGDKSTEGRVIQTEDAYRLTSSDGKEEKLSVDRVTGTLKDGSGATWKADNPPKTTVTLKEW